MKNAIVSLLLLLMVTQYVTAQKKVIKIACIGTVSYTHLTLPTNSLV